MAENSGVFNTNGSGGYGICDISVMPLRAEPNHRAEMVSQLLFGEHFTILKKSPKEDWIYIKAAFDGYEGWIDARKYKSISSKFFDIMNSMDWPVSRELISLVHGKDKIFPIMYGSVLPVYNQGVVAFENEAFKIQGEVYYIKKTNNFQFLQAVARYYLGAPYVWGGRSYFGIDCSGLVQQVFKICGHKLPRDSSQQVKVGEEVTFENLQPGDLAFFTNENGNVDHVGIAWEGRQILHASGEVRLDFLDKNGIYNPDKGEHTHKLYGLRRVW